MSGPGFITFTHNEEISLVSLLCSLFFLSLRLQQPRKKHTRCEKCFQWALWIIQSSLAIVSRGKARPLSSVFSAVNTKFKKINNTPATVVVKFSAHNIRATCMFTQNSGWLVFIKLVSINNSMVWTLKTHTIISVLSVVNLLGDPVHVCNLFLVADDLDGRPHILDHLGVRLPLLHHTWHDFLIHHNCGKTR